MTLDVVDASGCVDTASSGCGVPELAGGTAIVVDGDSTLDSAGAAVSSVDDSTNKYRSDGKNKN